MKLVTFLQAGEERFGFLHGDVVVDPLSASGDPALFGSALAFIKSGDRRDQGGADDPRSSRRSRPASRRATSCSPRRCDPRPSCAAAATITITTPRRRTRRSAARSRSSSSRPPIAWSVPDEPIVFDPLMSKKIDCEIELAIVIGKAGTAHPGRARARSRLRLHHRQRRDGARPPGAAHAGRHDLVRTRQRQGVRFERAARAVHRHRRRDRRPAKAQAAIADQRRACGSRAAPRT